MKRRFFYGRISRQTAAMHMGKAKPEHHKLVRPTIDDIVLHVYHLWAYICSSLAPSGACVKCVTTVVLIHLYSIILDQPMSEFVHI